MANVKIELLSPVHIGSGINLQQNIEYLIDNGRLAVIDEKKVLDIIGEENIQQWISCISKHENLLNLLRQRKKDIKISDVAQREMDVYGSDLKNKKSLKEQLHSAKNFPMIPGSSLKGAIRTAIITHLVNKNTNLVKRVIDNYKSFNKRKISGWSWRLRDFQIVEERILNKLLSNTERVDANRNVMRYLQVSDVTFQYNTIASNAKLLNLIRNGWSFKQGSDQLIEFIGQGSETSGRININKNLLEKNKPETNTEFFNSLEDLFNIINKHSISLLNDEINFWKEEKDYPETIGVYLEILQEIKDDVSSFNKREALLRLGGNTGWNSITGAWAKNNKELFNDIEWEILKKALNKNKDVDYFPKTRKIEEEGDVFGYLKLMIV